MTHHLCAMSSSCKHIYMCAMTHVCPSTCVTWLINLWHRLEIFWRNVQWTHCNTLQHTATHCWSHVCHDLCMPIYMCDITHSLTNTFMCIHEEDMAHIWCTRCLCHDSCMCGTHTQGRANIWCTATKCDVHCILMMHNALCMWHVCQYLCMCAKGYNVHHMFVYVWQYIICLPPLCMCATHTQVMAKTFCTSFVRHVFFMYAHECIC